MKIVITLDGKEINKESKLFGVLSRMFFKGRLSVEYEGVLYTRVLIETNATEAKLYVKKES